MLGSRSPPNNGKVPCLQSLNHFCFAHRMSESDWQSNLLLDLVQPVAPGDYLLNKAKIAEAKALISAYEEMNEVGKQSHDEIARELEQKIREGEKAR